MKCYLGVDIGATKISFALLKGKKIIDTRKILTPKKGRKIVERTEETIKEITNGIAGSQILGVGVGVAGPVDREKQLVLNPPNLKALWNFPLKQALEKRLSLKVKIENDANCFVLGEAIFGAGKKYRKVIGLTLGSGVGGGIVLKDSLSEAKIFRGAFGSAGEFGHMTINFDGPRCSCGSKGCFEEYASSKFFKRKTKHSPKEIENQARKGNKKAILLYREFGRYLGIGIANLVNILDPDIVIIGGSISKAAPLFLEQAKKEAQKRTLSLYSKKFVRIETARLGDFSPAIGAAFLIEGVKIKEKL